MVLGAKPQAPRSLATSLSLGQDRSEENLPENVLRTIIVGSGYGDLVSGTNTGLVLRYDMITLIGMKYSLKVVRRLWL